MSKPTIGKPHKQTNNHTTNMCKPDQKSKHTPMSKPPTKVTTKHANKTTTPTTTKANNNTTPTLIRLVLRQKSDRSKKQARSKGKQTTQ